MKFSADTSRAFRCPEPLWTRFERLAKGQGCSTDSLICDAMREFVDRWESNAGVGHGVGLGLGGDASRAARAVPFGSLIRGPSSSPSSGFPRAEGYADDLPELEELGDAAPDEAKAAALGAGAEVPQPPKKPAFMKTLPLGAPAVVLQPQAAGDAALRGGRAKPLAERREPPRSPAQRREPSHPSMAGTQVYVERTGEAPTPAEVPASRRTHSAWENSSPVSSRSGLELTPRPQPYPGGASANSTPSTPVHAALGSPVREQPTEVPASPGIAQASQFSEASSQPQQVPAQPVQPHQTLRIVEAPQTLAELTSGGIGINPRGWVLSIEFMGASFTVCKERYIIGRDKHTCDLTIKDPNVSRQHAMVECVGSRYYIVDLGSTNGIDHQGRKVHRHPINQGDVFTICEHRFQFSFRFVR